MKDPVVTALPHVRVVSGALLSSQWTPAAHGVAAAAHAS